MEFEGYVIDDSEIIGIGPIMQRDYPDLDTRLVYNPKQMFFSLILKRQVVELKSDWVNTTGDTADNLLVKKSLLKQFNDEYKKLVFKVAAILEIKGANKL